MPYQYRCPKCRRIHSEQEYRERRFCRKCGTYLPVKSKIWKAGPEGRGREGRRDAKGLFPYRPYSQQLEFMRDIEGIVGSGRVLVAEACNGFGKTVCALSALLPLERRIVYATRTHEQVRQVLEEMERINGKSSREFLAVNLASRSHLCLDRRCSTLSAGEGLEACRILREEERCRHKWDLEGYEPVLSPVLSIAELRRYGEAENVCPYFLARKMAEKSHVIVAPYQYVFDPMIRQRMGLELSDKVLVFDEAHNADSIGIEVLSDTLSERALMSARQELDWVKKKSGFIARLEEYLGESVSDHEAVARPGIELHEDLSRVLGGGSIGSVVELYSVVVDEIRARRMGEGQSPVCYLSGVLRFLSLVNSDPKDCYVAVYRKTTQGLRLIEYRCLDPSLAIRPVVDQVQGTLIMSGTLAPMKLCTEVMGIPEAEIRTYSAIAKPENIQLTVDPSVTTRFSERGEAMTVRYGEKIAGIVESIPNGVLIFFPQRRFMLRVLSEWNRGGIARHDGSSMFLGGKRLFLEGQDAAENRRVVEEYKRTAESVGAVLCCVFRGRNAEGSNFPDEQARGVILVGIPYANISDPVVRARIGYLNRKREGLGEKWYQMDAFKAANQAIGRGIRHKDDWCRFFLMDQRYKTSLNLLSSWVLSGSVNETSPDGPKLCEDSTSQKDSPYHRLSHDPTV